MDTYLHLSHERAQCAYNGSKLGQQLEIQCSDISAIYYYYYLVNKKHQAALNLSLPPPPTSFSLPIHHTQEHAHTTNVHVNNCLPVQFQLRGTVSQCMGFQEWCDMFISW